MNKGGLLLVVIVGFLAGLTGAYYAPSILPPHGATASGPAAAKKSTYDRVMRTGTIKCGYAIWPPLLSKDPNSGQLSGIAYDYLEGLGKALNLKVEWAEEVGWGDFPVALENGRIDAFCTSAWPTASRARQIDFAKAIVFQPIYAYVRSDDARFDNKIAAINDPSVTIAAMDGEMSSLIAASDFPKAKTVQISQVSSPSELLLNVATGKADVTFTDAVTAGQYNATNSIKLRAVITKTPLRAFGDTVAIARGQDEFRRMLDIATDELISSGQAERFISKYEEYPGTLLRSSSPYVQPQ